MRDENCPPPPPIGELKQKWCIMGIVTAQPRAFLVALGQHVQESKKALGLRGLKDSTTDPYNTGLRLYVNQILKPYWYPRIH